MNIVPRSVMYVDEVAETHACVVTPLEMVAAARAALRRTQLPPSRPRVLMVYTNVIGADVPHFGLPPQTRIGPMAFAFSHPREVESAFASIRLPPAVRDEVLASDKIPVFVQHARGWSLFYLRTLEGPPDSLQFEARSGQFGIDTHHHPDAEPAEDDIMHPALRRNPSAMLQEFILFCVTSVPAPLSRFARSDGLPAAIGVSRADARAFLQSDGQTLLGNLDHLLEDTDTTHHKPGALQTASGWKLFIVHTDDGRS